MISTLLLAAALANPNPVCTKLMDDFVKNEQSFARIHKFYQSIYEAYRPLGDPFATATAREDLAKTDREYPEKGDRLVTLMLGNKCPLPDHVTSPFTYPPSAGGTK